MSWSSGTNTIKEGSESKSLTLQMLEVKKQGGGTELFVRKNDVKLGTKSVNKNGTYTAAADGKYGFSQFSVNVRGGNGSADSHGKPTGGDIKPGGAGSAVVGTDPETGNDVVVGVDEDENLVKTPLPSSIVLVTNPTKMDYNDGETIDLSGAVVVAKMADGTTWTDADHPNGHVSCSPEPATADESQGPSMISNVSAAETRLARIYTTGWPYPRTTVKVNDGPAYYSVLKAGGYWVNVVVAETKAAASVKNIETYAGYNGYPPGTPDAIYGPSEPPDDNNYRGYWYNALYGTKGDIIECDGPIYEGSITEMIDSVISGDLGGTQTITLNWARPGDGKVLSTTMEINVGAHTTTSSNGTEGSGGGGSF